MSEATTSIRRSSRRRERVAYESGMIVELVNRTGGRSKGRLVSKLTDQGSSSLASNSNPRWLVSFDDESFVEEDVYESSLGAVLGKADPHKTKNHNNKKFKRKNATTETVLSSAGEKRASRSSSPSGGSSKTSPSTVTSPEERSNNNNSSNNKKNKKKRKASETIHTPDKNANDKNADKEEQEEEEEEKSPPGSDVSATKTKAAQARAARSQRRQARLEEEHAQRLLQMPEARGSNNKRAKKNADVPPKNVVRIPMLTGTLFLYRGSRRRAEFVYKK